MGISENTRAAELKKMEDSMKQMQDSWNDMISQQKDQQDEIRSEMRSIQTQQLQTRMETDKVYGDLQTLVIGLSAQVLQLNAQVNNYNGGFQGGNHNFSRFSKVEFPKFAGEDVLGWIYKCENFFDIDATTETTKVKIASFHLEGKALLWHQSFMKGLRNGEWPN